MKQESKSISNAAVNAYAAAATFQSYAIHIPDTYLSIFMTTYLGITAAMMATVYLVSMTLDIILSLLAGGLIDIVKFKKGKYLPWLNFFRWFVMFGAVGQFIDTSKLSLAVRMIVISVCYITMHGSMNFMSTAQNGIIAAIGGFNMEDRIRLTTRRAQVSAAGTIILSFSTLPLITFFGRLSGNEAGGYTIVCAIYCLALVLGTTILTRYTREYDEQASSAAPEKKYSVKDMWDAIAGNDQMIVYAVSQLVRQVGMLIVGGMGMYYWKLIMDKYQYYSVSSGITTFVGFLFSLFNPSIGRKMGKIKAMKLSIGLGAVLYIALRYTGLKSIWFMTAFSVVSSAFNYLTAGFGINYYLDIGEYGYYKTGRDYRTLCVSMSNILMKIGRLIGRSLSGYVLAWIGFDRFNQMMLDGVIDRTSPDFTRFADLFMDIYCFVPLVTRIIGLVILAGYKIKDEDAVFYARENARREAGEARQG